MTFMMSRAGEEFEQR